MSVFEFVVVLVSIVIGLAMAELFGGVARILRGDLRAYWIHGLWVLQIWILQILTWWALWGDHERKDWDFASMVLLLPAPALLFLAAVLLFPGRAEKGELRPYYFAKRRVLFATMAAFPVSYQIIYWATLGVAPLPDAFRIAQTGLLLSLAWSGNVRLHGILSLVSLVGIVFYVVLITPDLESIGKYRAAQQGAAAGTVGGAVTARGTVPASVLRAPRAEGRRPRRS